RKESESRWREFDDSCGNESLGGTPRALRWAWFPRRDPSRVHAPRNHALRKYLRDVPPEPQRREEKRDDNFVSIDHYGSTNWWLAGRTVRTGHGALRTIRSATLPIKTCASPERP